MFFEESKQLREVTNQLADRKVSPNMEKDTMAAAQISSQAEHHWLNSGRDFQLIRKHLKAARGAFFLKPADEATGRPCDPLKNCATLC